MYYVIILNNTLDFVKHIIINFTGMAATTWLSALVQKTVMCSIVIFLCKICYSTRIKWLSLEAERISVYVETNYKICMLT